MIGLLVAGLRSQSWSQSWSRSRSQSQSRSQSRSRWQLQSRSRAQPHSLSRSQSRSQLLSQSRALSRPRSWSRSLGREDWLATAARFVTYATPSITIYSTRQGAHLVAEEWLATALYDEMFRRWLLQDVHNRRAAARAYAALGKNPVDLAKKQIS